MFVGTRKGASPLRVRKNHAIRYAGKRFDFTRCIAVQLLSLSKIEGKFLFSFHAEMVCLLLVLRD